ncbi:hypothetical protein ACKWTF_014941 [Chironomus riparius]
MNKMVQGNVVEAKALIDSVKVKCFDSEFYEFKKNLKNLEIEEQNLKLENFKIWAEKFENLENYFKNSRFSNLNYFKDKFEHLKQKLPTLLIIFLSQLEHNLKNSQTCSAVDEKLTSMPQNFAQLAHNLVNIDEKLTKLTFNFDNFKDQVEDVKNIPAIVSKRLHKFEIDQKAIKSKIHSIDEKINKIIGILQVEN